jgi:hypothetical protein
VRDFHWTGSPANYAAIYAFALKKYAETRGHAKKEQLDAHARQAALL